MTKLQILDELPSDGRRDFTKGNPAIAAAMDNPGKWVAYSTSKTRASAQVVRSQLRRGRMKTFKPALFDVEVRTLDESGTTTIFIRYNAGVNA